MVTENDDPLLDKLLDWIQINRWHQRVVTNITMIDVPDGLVVSNQ